jgi:hypothetical protein
MQGWTGLRRFVLGISRAETNVERRRFRGGDASIHARLEQIGRAFLLGYHASVEYDDPEELAGQLELADREVRGWVYEGAAMGLALLDLLSLRDRSRFSRFARGPGAPHIYMLHVGAGWAMARVPWGRRRFGTLDPLLRWLAMDGYGFHETYFHWPRTLVEKTRPAGLGRYASRAFDQGVGRALWFVDGAEVDRIGVTIEEFRAPRQSDLWSGVGLACGYAGGASASALHALRARAGAHAAHLAQGVAFAAKARLHAGTMAPHTELACRIVCSLGAEETAAITDRALPPSTRPETKGARPDEVTLGSDGEPAYEEWRRRIREELAAPKVAV